ncbi:beta-1,3-glucan-binding protein-like [Saccostrea echinata]|uniref:beta-1,3-glucan-binding protein-like n=1 Tax=Saccostrea echinata TaxID=191078 RepID=UPI002A806C4C|nr:beta-1,3-glucan-binding protein-like [Saccostrea echinata]
MDGIYFYNGVWEHIDSEANVKVGDIIHYQTILRRKNVLKELKWKSVNLLPENAVAPVRSLRKVTVFRDDFNTFDKSHYKIEITAAGGGNGEFQVYTPEQSNIYAAHGFLYIKPTLTVDHPSFTESDLYNGQMDVPTVWGACTKAMHHGCHKAAYGNGQEILNPVMSGLIYTHAAIKYGRVNVRARIPRGDWLWPAIWLMPTNSVYGSWPRSGEIDVMEARGNRLMNTDTGINRGIHQIASTLNWGPDPRHSAGRLTHKPLQSTHGDWHKWHVFSLEWTEQHVICLVDDQEILHVNTPPEGFWKFGHFNGTNIWGNSLNAPFDQPFQLLLNVAVGGTKYFPDNLHYDTPKPWRNDSPHPMRDFWEKRNVWLPTWHGDNIAFLIDYVEMIQY